MGNFARKFQFGASTFALLATSSYLITGAYAQNAAQGSVPETVVVTGTSIAGSNVVGTNVITMSADDLATTGAETVQQALADNPVISGFGNAGEGSTIHNNYYQPSIHDLGASASNATLVLIDGHLPPTGGTNHSTSDPNIIPSNMLERVDVVANGDSSIYGSNAVAGVINFVTRSQFDGVQLNAQGDVLHGATNFTAGVLSGTSWANGSVVFAYQYYDQGKIDAADRSFSENENQTARAIDAGLPVSTSNAQTNFDTFTGAGPSCSQPLVRLNGGGNYYNVVTGQQYTTASSSAPCNLAADMDLIQQEVRNNAMMKIKQDFGPLSVGADILVASREDQGNPSPGGNGANNGRGTVSAVTAFATGSQANPFFEVPAGYAGPAPTSETIYANLDGILGGPGIVSVNGATDIMADVTAEYRLGGDWALDALAVVGRDDSYSRSIGGTEGSANASSVDLALNGTTNPSGSTTQPAVAGTNLVPTNLPLTIANALDIWGVGSANQTSQATKNSILDNRSLSENISSYQQWRLVGNGTVFKLPAGPLKIALGIEADSFDLEQQGVSANGTGPASLGSTYLLFDFHRMVYSAFGELDTPIISPEMNVPLVRKFEINASGRYDDYSDVGPTANYKLAFDWGVTDDLKLRGNVSTSFVAPGLDIIGNQYGAFLTANYGLNTALSGIPISTATYPTLTQFPASAFSNGKPCTASSGTCTLASTVQGVEINNGDPNAKPELGRGWEVGADYAPRFLPGLLVDATLWNTEFLGAITGPTIGNIVNNSGLNSQLTLYPNGISQTAVNTMATGIRQSSALPSVISYVWYSTNTNWLNLYLEGIDASVKYNFDTDWGSFRIGDSFTDFLKFNESFGQGGVPFSVLNTTGANGSFPSIAFQQRSNVGWSNGPWTADLFANFTGPYRNWSGTSVIPLVKDAQGNPVGGGDPVKANLTFDLHMGYSFRGGIFGDDMITFTVINLLDTNPPFYLGSQGYDSWAGNPLGREFEIGLTSKL